MKITKLLIIFLWLPIIIRGEEFHFFSSEDIACIRSSASTIWGKKIITALESNVVERRKHILKVPLLEGGHGHDYFCPVHRIRFSFNWDSPTRHYCPRCMKYYEGNKRYDWAWSSMVHYNNAEYLRDCMFLYLATGKDCYALYIRDMMLDYATKYITYLEHDTERKVGPWGGKMYAQSLDESVWASDACRAYVVAKPLMTTDEIQRIEQGYLRPCAELLLRRRGTANWQVWHNSGLAALGIALQDDNLVHVAIDDPQCGYRTMMRQYVAADGWWGEGSPTYHYYPLRAMLLTAEVVRCCNINLYDDQLLQMLVNPARGVYADLHFPSHNDGWYGESLSAQASLYELAYKRFNNDFILNILRQCYRHTERLSVEALLNNTTIKPADIPPTDWPSTLFENVGYAVLRSGIKTVVLKYGPHGGGHGHPDKLSISIHDGKKELVSDLGTCAYGIPTYHNWYRKTLAHSTMTVDAHDQHPTTGFLLDFHPSTKGGKASAQTTNAYQGVSMKRTLMLNNNTLTDLFTAISDTVHLYDYVLILTEKPNFEIKGTAITLNDAVAYQNIVNAYSIPINGEICCRIGPNKLHIRIKDATQAEIIVGEAPGIPGGNETNSTKNDASLCYPLIIRMHSLQAIVETKWEFE